MTIFSKLSLLLIGIVMTTYANAQSSDCRINYAYDVAGNRIRRSFSCASQTNPGDETNPTKPKLISSLLPNPTAGLITGIFSEPITGVFVEVSDMSGIVLETRDIDQSSGSFSLDLSGQIPGTYIITIRVPGLAEGYTVIKM